MVNSVIDIPKTVNEVLNCQDSNKWLEAMKVEYESLIRNETQDLVGKLVGKNIIGRKWVFALKYNVDGSNEKCKARVVAQECSQKYSIDFYETFAPVVRHLTIR